MRFDRSASRSTRHSKSSLSPRAAPVIRYPPIGPARTRCDSWRATPAFHDRVPRTRDSTRPAASGSRSSTTTTCCCQATSRGWRQPGAARRTRAWSTRSRWRAWPTAARSRGASRSRSSSCTSETSFISPPRCSPASSRVRDAGSTNRSRSWRTGISSCSAPSTRRFISSRGRPSSGARTRVIRAPQAARTRTTPGSLRSATASTASGRATTMRWSTASAPRCSKPPSRQSGAIAQGRRRPAVRSWPTARTIPTRSTCWRCCSARQGATPRPAGRRSSPVPCAPATCLSSTIWRSFAAQRAISRAPAHTASGRCASAPQFAAARKLLARAVSSRGRDFRGYQTWRSATRSTHNPAA